MGLVVFTDLDGTLLDHDTYSFAEAAEALTALTVGRTPLVLTSSKTRAEMALLWAELGLDAPFISENGGGVFAPADHPFAAGGDWAEAGGGWRVLALGMPVDELRRRLAPLKERFGVRGFLDMDDLEVSRLTGLPPERARLSREREFNEPVLLARPEEDADEFARAAANAGLSVTRGGRFFHVLGGGDKGRAVALVAGLYRAADPGLITMALGDAANDLPMLAQVDLAVQVARPDGSHAPLELEGLLKHPLPGPRAFNAAVLAALEGRP